MIYIGIDISSCPVLEDGEEAPAEPSPVAGGSFDTVEDGPQVVL